MDGWAGGGGYIILVPLLCNLLAAGTPRLLGSGDAVEANFLFLKHHHKTHKKTASVLYFPSPLPPPHTPKLPRLFGYNSMCSAQPYRDATAYGPTRLRPSMIRLHCPLFPPPPPLLPLDQCITLMIIRRGLGTLGSSKRRSVTSRKTALLSTYWCRRSAPAVLLRIQRIQRIQWIGNC